jgi:hypothetical protein
MVETWATYTDRTGNWHVTLPCKFEYEGTNWLHSGRCTCGLYSARGSDGVWYVSTDRDELENFVAVIAVVVS